MFPKPLLAALLLLPLAASITTFAPRAALASTVMPLDLDALAEGAHRVALARVESQVSRFTADRSTIYTEVTLRVLESIKGEGIQAGDTVVVRREGGEVEGQGVRVIGSPEFQDGEEVLVFLEQRGPGRAVARTQGTPARAAPLYVMGMAQGKLRVEQRAGRRVVVRQRAGLSFTAPQRHEPAVEPLDDVLRRVRARIAPAGAR